MAVSLVACALVVALSKPKYTLSLFEGSLVLRRGAEVTRIPIEVSPPKPLLVAPYRRDRAFAVWDDRGLTVRSGRYVHSTRLTEIPVSPKLFRADEIRRTVHLIHGGVRTKDAASLSGSRRIGKDVYFLVRWTESSGKPWLEALVRVDLAERHPAPVLVGRFEGLSTASSKIDQKLFLTSGRVAVATQRDHDWGIATYNPKAAEFGFTSVGDRLLDVSPAGLFTEQTACGTVLGGFIDFATAIATPLFEDRPGDHPPFWLDDSLPGIALTNSPNGKALRDCETGAELPISDRAVARRAGNLVAVWSPAKNPTHAYIYNPTTWRRLAEWHRGLGGARTPKIAL